MNNSDVVQLSAAVCVAVQLAMEPRFHVRHPVQAKCKDGCRLGDGAGAKFESPQMVALLSFAQFCTKDHDDPDDPDDHGIVAGCNGL